MDRKSGSVVMLFFALLVFGVLSMSGNLSDGPQIVDDNQIYRLQIELSESSFGEVARNEIATRTLSYRRFVPVFSLHKVFQAAVLGVDLLHWSVYTGLMSVLTGLALFCSAKILGFNVAESLVFSLVTLLGKQSVVWWKLIQGEGLGMLLLSISLVFMGASLSSGKYQNVSRASFVFFAVLASATKESFILMLPALAFWRYGLVYERNGWRLKSALLENLPVAVPLLVVFSAELILIEKLIGRTATAYGVGWDGLRLGEAAKAAAHFSSIGNIKTYLTLVAMALALAVFAAARGASRGISEDLIRWCFALVLFLMIVAPQVLLYQILSRPEAVAYSGRYLLPAAIGFAYLFVFLLRHIRIRSRDAIPRKRASRPLSFVHALLVLLPLGIAFLHLGGRLRTAYEGAAAYARKAETINEWFTSIRTNTHEDDAILIVFDGRKSPRVPLRISFILEGLLDRKNLWYLSLPVVNDVSALSRGTRDLRRHMKGMRNLPLGQLGQIKAIVIPRYPEMSRAFGREFLSESGLGFDPVDFNKYVNERGHVSYYRNERAPGPGRLVGARAVTMAPGRQPPATGINPLDISTPYSVSASSVGVDSRGR